MAPALSDTELYNNIIMLINKFNIGKIYETGSNIGGSTYILCKISENIKVFSYELDQKNYKLAVEACKNCKNVSIKNVSSPIGLKEDIEYGDNKILLFLDAHGYNYSPIIDELSVIYDKKVLPCLLIHDFYVPGKNGKAKFGFDTYNRQALNLEYIKTSINSIYGVSKYNYFYSETSSINSGVIYIYPI